MSVPTPEEKVRAAIAKDQLEVLACLFCNEFIGWVYAFDMNENYEVCAGCVAAIKAGTL